MIDNADRDGCGGPHDHQQTEHICGRPLGLCFDETRGDLYIADAYMGLLRVGTQGGLATKIVTHAQGIPLRFTNGLDIDQSSGAIYFTDSSSQYQRRYVKHFIFPYLLNNNNIRRMFFVFKKDIKTNLN
jgi:sugar lactone lactonase YvrE